LHPHAATERLVGFVVTIDSSDFSKTVQAFGGFLVSWLKILTVTAPWSVESSQDGEKPYFRSGLARLTPESDRESVTRKAEKLWRHTEVWFDLAMSLS